MQKTWENEVIERRSLKKFIAFSAFTVHLRNEEVDLYNRWHVLDVNREILEADDANHRSESHVLITTRADIQKMENNSQKEI